MHPCSQCNRHVREADTTCPFCGKARGVPRLLNTVGGAFTALVLAACYGVPSDARYDDTANDSAVTDVDADGYASDVDCDDSNADIHPGAVEVCDDTVDNDCDSKVDADDEDCAAK